MIVKKSTFNVEGMTCQGCVNSVRRSIEQLPGVQQVDVSLAEKRAVVTYDEAGTNDAAIRERIEDAGFEVKG